MVPAWLRREALVCPNGCTGSRDLPFGHGCSVDALSKDVLENLTSYLRGGWLLASSIKRCL